MNTREEIIRNYIDGYNRFDIPKMLKDFADDIVFENIQNHVTTDSLEGINAFQEQAEMAKEYFSNRTQTIIAFHHHIDYTEIEIDYEATLAFDFPGSLKKGDKIQLKGKSIFTFSDANKIQKLLDIS
ncbi:nuclear transport factor 2 family protein [Sphingobacterium sp. DK4209]|uniref:Nuclear transport factor 2 family protein n=1 Tax=Sphingobacterium zhuxiongii TaxID=2662364 RepID=A0A5Q0QEV1_9SPHI|nr:MULTISPECIES: nuclear transport factor 2 family protein [unclassified Sphingobacterium]MVZ65669.1 nuclear transport factor 2 family protein [Sphingobacterium sp. DK4209]QGA27789.1 nuclear transport factor 2 family protein [Sphingobacterium sp. dk4302]